MEYSLRFRDSSTLEYKASGEILLDPMKLEMINHTANTLNCAADPTDRTVLLYDTTGASVLGSKLDGVRLDFGDLKHLLCDLAAGISGIARQGIAPSNIILSKDSVFMSAMDMTPRFLCLPTRQGDGSWAGCAAFFRELVLGLNAEGCSALIGVVMEHTARPNFDPAALLAAVSGATPSGTMPSAARPAGAMPAGAMPSSAMPIGAMPAASSEDKLPFGKAATVAAIAAAIAGVLSCLFNWLLELLADSVSGSDERAFFGTLADKPWIYFIGGGLAIAIASGVAFFLVRVFAPKPEPHRSPAPQPEFRQPPAPAPAPQPEFRQPPAPAPAPRPEFRQPPAPAPAPQPEFRQPPAPAPAPQPEFRQPPAPAPQPEFRQPPAPAPAPQPEFRQPPAPAPAPQPEFRQPPAPAPAPQPEFRRPPAPAPAFSPEDRPVPVERQAFDRPAPQPVGQAGGREYTPDGMFVPVNAAVNPVPQAGGPDENTWMLFKNNGPVGPAGPNRMGGAPPMNNGGMPRPFLKSADQPNAAPFFMSYGAHLIGRSSACELRIKVDTVSGRHAVINVTPNGSSITDEHSTNGTFVNGVRLSPGIPRPLHHGDTVLFYKVRYDFFEH